MNIEIESCLGCPFDHLEYVCREEDMHFCKLMPGAPLTINEDRKENRVSLDCPLRKWPVTIKLKA